VLKIWVKVGYSARIESVWVEDEERVQKFQQKFLSGGKWGNAIWSAHIVGEGNAPPEGFEKEDNEAFQATPPLWQRPQEERVPAGHVTRFLAECDAREAQLTLYSTSHYRAMESLDEDEEPQKRPGGSWVLTRYGNEFQWTTPPTLDEMMKRKPTGPHRSREDQIDPPSGRLFVELNLIIFRLAF